MNETRQKMDSALKEIVIPKLRKIGFKGSIPHLRRIINSEIHLFSFQFDRYGGGFVIEIARAENKPFKTYWGKIIEPKKLTAHDLNKRTRIHPKGILENSSTDDWFRYDKSKQIFGDIYTKVAKQVLSQIDLIEDIFSNEIKES